MRRLTEADDGRDQRQLGVVDAQGRGATFTGPACHDWAGGRTGPGYAAQGNILVSGDTVDALAETFESSSGALAERLLEALAAAQAAGGDKRGQQSAALIVVERDGGYAGLSDTPRRPARRRPRGADRGAAAALRAAPAAVRHDARARSGCRWTTSCALEIDGHLARLGYERLEDWAGAANLEERVDGDGEIDPVVLNELRRRR